MWPTQRKDLKYICPRKLSFLAMTVLLTGGVHRLLLMERSLKSSRTLATFSRTPDTSTILTDNLPTPPWISWRVCENECCTNALQVIRAVKNAEPNLVCFDLNFGEVSEQRFIHLTTFSPAFSFYLSMAQSFFTSIAAHSSFSGEVIWRIEDDATIEPVLQSNFTAVGVATVGHSVHVERGDPSQYTTLVPNFHFIQHDGYASLSQHAVNSITPTESLHPQVFWAGSTTGVPCRGTEPCAHTCEDLQRFQLVRLSREIEWLNFSITNAIQWCAGNLAEMRRENMMTNHVEEKVWMNYRGILDVDGNVDAWGLRWRLATNGVVFKVNSDYINHYSAELIDGIHFIGISKNLTDLRTKTAIIQNSDAESLNYLANVSNNARQIIANITYESAVLHSAHLLTTFFNSM